MLTNSAEVVMREFTDSIIEIEAESSIDNWNRDELRRDYGMMRERLDRTKVSLDYHEIRDMDGNPENPLNSTQVDDLMHELNRRLKEVDGEAPADLAVSKLVLRLDVPEITPVTRSMSDEYELTFISDPATGEYRNRTEELNAEKGLYHELGFEYRNLNLRSVLETRAKYAEQGDAKLMGWGGPDDIRPRCSTGLAQAVLSAVLPDEYAQMKTYRVTDENVLEVVEPDDEEYALGADEPANGDGDE
jgi:hypothetical protein